MNERLSKMRLGWLSYTLVAVVLFIGPLIVSVIAYVTVQRGPIHAVDCFITDDFFIDVEGPSMTLSAFTSSVKQDTRNCVSVNVVSGPTSDDAIVSSPTGSKWFLSRGEYTVDVWTVPAQE